MPDRVATVTAPSNSRQFYLFSFCCEIRYQKYVFSLCVFLFCGFLYISLAFPASCLVFVLSYTKSFGGAALGLGLRPDSAGVRCFLLSGATSIFIDITYM